MPLSLPILAAGITIIVPGFLAANIFLVSLHLWADRLLRTDTSMRERLRIEAAAESFGWTVRPGSLDRRPPFVPLVGTALAAVVLTVGETALFVATSDVPRFWCLSGAIATLVMAISPFIVARMFRTALGRRIELALVQRANDRLAFALPDLFAVSQVDAQSDELYTSLALHRRAGALDVCQRIVLEHAGAKQDVALSVLSAAKSAAERDLRNLQSLAAEIRAGATLVTRAKDRADDADSLKEEAARVEQAIQSRALADALEAGRWSDATLVIEKIQPDLDRLSAAMGADSGMPRSVEDAYRVLNVRDDTQLDSIKTILSTYRRIWHPDRARDETERVLFTLKTQKLNVAWDLIQRARGLIRREPDPSKA